MATPTITSISPGRGRAGTSITITGTSFSASGNEITVGGESVVAVDSEGTTEIVCDVPSGIATDQHLAVIVTQASGDGGESSEAFYWWSKQSAASLKTANLPGQIPSEDEVGRGLTNEYPAFCEAKDYERALTWLEELRAALGSDLVGFLTGETVYEILEETINGGLLQVPTVSQSSSGLQVEWTSGEVFDRGTPAVVEVGAGSGSVTDDSITYLKWVSGTSLTLSTTAPTADEVVVAVILAQDGEIWNIDTSDRLYDRSTAISRALSEMFPTAVAANSGLLISEDDSSDSVSDLDVVLSAGTFILHGHEIIEVPETYSRITAMVRWFHTSGAWDRDTSAEVDPTQYDDGTDLAPTAAAKYYKSAFFVAAEGIHWIYPTAGYNTLAQAIAADPPPKPPGLETLPYSVSVILKGDDTTFPAAGSNRWRDIRPRVGFAGSRTITDHGSLAGLTDVADHPSYLTLDGSRPLTGYLDFTEVGSEPSVPAADVLRLFALDEAGYSTLHTLDDAGHTFELGRDRVHVVRNNSGGTLTKGTVVYIAGSTGVYPTVEKAKADSASTLPAFGVVMADISDASFGRIISGGDLEGLDIFPTASFSNGDVLYVSATTAGEVTTTEPTGTTNYVQRIGEVVKASDGNAGIMGVLIGDSDPAALTDGSSDASSYHNHDGRYYRENEHINSSAGAGDAGKPIVLDAAGHVDASMLNDADIDHGSIGGLADDDHSQYHNDARGDARYYTETELDAGQLDNRYYTETELDGGALDALYDASGSAASAVATHEAGEDVHGVGALALEDASDIGKDLDDADTLLVNDGDSDGGNKKSALSRFWTYISGKLTSYKLDDLGSPDDNTDLNATASAHGLLPKLSDVATEYLNGDGGWSTPPDTVYDGDIADLNINGGNDIGKALDDADLLIVDDDGSGGNKKSALSRFWTYILTKIKANLGLDDISDVSATGGSTGDVLTQQGDGTFALETPSGGGLGYTLCYGGTVDTSKNDEWFYANGNGGENGSAGADNQETRLEVPVASTLDKMAYYGSVADDTTTVTIFEDGVSQGDVTCSTATEGVEELNNSVAAGSYLSIRGSGTGTAFVQGTISFYMS